MAKSKALNNIYSFFKQNKHNHVMTSGKGKRTMKKQQ